VIPVALIEVCKTNIVQTVSALLQDATNSEIHTSRSLLLVHSSSRMLRDRAGVHRPAPERHFVVYRQTHTFAMRGIYLPIIESNPSTDS
jgi:hypothetical protein